MRKWTWRVAGILLAALLGVIVAGTLGPLVGGHDPNHGIDREKARAAAGRVHPTPKPGEKMLPGAGG